MRFSNLITAVDAHACGEPGRVITGGVLDVPGASMFEKMKWFATNADHIRLRMLREPRGYPASNCNLILPATHPDAQAGYIIMEQVEYPAMSGSNTICVATVLIETGMVAVQEPVTKLLLETPAGLIAIDAEVRQGKVKRVTFRNVPAFAVHLDTSIEVKGLGTVTVDVAWGGMFYVLADAGRFGLGLTPNEAGETARIAELIKVAAQEQLPRGSIRRTRKCAASPSPRMTGPSPRAGVHGKNNVVVSTGTLGCLDRSPCGTGTCARMAVLHAKGQLPLHQDFVHEGVPRTTFTAG